MSEKVIQEQFGEVVINALRDFATRDIKSTDELRKQEFSHIGDPVLRTTLAQTFHGALWLYKLGLATLAEGDARIAHIRAQIIDYGSICEAALSDAVRHGIFKQHFTKPGFTFRQPWSSKEPLVWPTSSNGIDAQMRKKVSFAWLIYIANEEGLIDSFLKKQLESLKDQRNSVHLTQKVAAKISYYLGLASRSRKTVMETLAATKAWKATHL